MIFKKESKRLEKTYHKLILYDKRKQHTQKTKKKT